MRGEPGVILALALALAAAATGCGDGATATGVGDGSTRVEPSPRDAGARVEPSPPSPPAVDLRPGSAVESALSAGAPHTYHMRGVAAGDLLEVSVEQIGINARFRLLGPDGAKVAEQSSVAGTQGTERMALLAPASGDYTLVVKASRARAPSGRVRLSVGRWGSPDAAGRRRAAAWTALAHARDLTLQAGPGLATAPDAWDRAEALARRAGDRGWQADAVAGRAWAELLLGNPARARPLWQEAHRRYRAVGDAVGEARTLYAEAEAEADLGHLDRALSMWQQVVERCRAVGDMADAAKALNNVGSIYADLGEPRRALDLLAQAEDAIRAYGGDAAYTILTQATVYHRLGNADRALPLYRQAQTMLHRDRLVWDEATAVEEAARLHLDLRREPEKARRMFTRALALHREAHDAIGAASAQVGIGDALRLQGDVAGAMRAHRQALAVFEAKGRREGRADALVALAADQLAELAPGQGPPASDPAARAAQADAAARTAERAVAAARALGRRSQEAEVLATLARIERARARPAAALRDTDAALALAEDLRTHIVAPELRTTQFASQVRDLYQLRIDLILGGRAHVTGAAAETAFEDSERSRARTLVDELSAGHPVAPHTAPALAVRHTKAAQALKLAELSHLALLARGAPAPEIASAAHKVERAISRLHDADAAIRAADPHYAALFHAPPTRLGAVQAALPDGANLLEIFLGAERSYAWVVTPTSVDAFVLPARDRIERAVRRLRRPLSAPQRSPAGESLADRKRRLARALRDGDRAAHALSELVLGPLGGHLDAPRLLLVVGGSLGSVPFAALYQPGDSAARLVQSHQLAMLPSAGALLAMRRRVRRPPDGRVLILADPVFDAADSREAHPAPPGGRERFARLRFSRIEARSIGALAPGSTDLALDFAASRATLTGAAARRARILHIASHGILDQDDPDLSGVVLSLVDRKGHPLDGLIRLHELYDLDLSADLVVVSACQTALGRSIRGEGVIGLARGFLYAGARRVVASLWRVHDRGTSVLMERFYRGMLDQGLSPAAALRRAQLSMMSEPRWSAPYYWAAFVLEGEL